MPIQIHSLKIIIKKHSLHYIFNISLELGVAGWLRCHLSMEREIVGWEFECDHEDRQGLLYALHLSLCLGLPQDEKLKAVPSSETRPDQTRNKLELTLAFHNLKPSHWKLSIYQKAFFFFFLVVVVVVSAGPGTCYMHIYIDSRILYYWVTFPDLASLVHRKKELLSFGLLVSASQTWGKFIYFWKCQVTLGILPSPDSQLSADYLTHTRLGLHCWAICTSWPSSKVLKY